MHKLSNKKVVLFIVFVNVLDKNVRDLDLGRDRLKKGN